MNPPRPDGGTPVSPMGRYAPAPADDDVAVEARRVTVRLLGVPVRVLAAGREHHDSLLAELRSRALDQRGTPEGTPPRLVELIDVLGRQYAVARPRPDADVDAALDAGQDTVDLSYDVPVAAARAAEALEVLMVGADDFCRDGLLLTSDRSDVLKDFSRWYTEQFVEQAAGREPVPWSGPVDPA